MAATTSKTGNQVLLAAARRKFPNAVRRAIEVFEVDGSPSEREYRLKIVRPGMKEWSTTRVAGSPEELLLHLGGPPVA